MSEGRHGIRPSILSIHPTMHCDYHCVGCYLKKDIEDNAVEKSPDFFAKLLRTAKKVGMKELAVPMNYSKETGEGKDKNIDYYRLFQRVCKEEELDLSMTCNYDFFTSYPTLDLSGVSLVSISLNDFVTGTPAKRDECLSVIDRLKKEKVPIVNCNVLLSDHMVKLLKEGLAEQVLRHSDSIYLITSKPLRTPLAKAGEWYSQLADVLPLDSERVLMDTCIKYAFGLTGGVCDKHQMIYVNPYGEIKMCSFDSKNLAVLGEAEEFEDVYNSKFPQEYQPKCSLMGM